jgi:hypothetical protein
MRSTLLAVVCSLTAGLSPPLAAAEPKSGPQPGTTVASFSPLNVTGPDAGDRQCLV